MGRWAEWFIKLRRTWMIEKWNTRLWDIDFGNNLNNNLMTGWVSEFSIYFEIYIVIYTGLDAGYEVHL